MEYVSDFVIGPRERGQPLNNYPGDSGTLWFEDILSKRRRTPLARESSDLSRSSGAAGKCKREATGPGFNSRWGFAFPLCAASSMSM